MKKFLFGFFAAILVVFILTACGSCNNSAEVQHEPADSAATNGEDSTQTFQPSQRKSATLGLSYFPVMHRNETRDVNVYVSVKYPTSLVRDTLRSIVIEQTSHYGREDTSVIYTINVIWYKTLDVSLLDPAGDFTITQVHPDNKQVVDTVNGNRWRWSITTKTDKKEALMVLKVIAAKEDGSVDRFDDKTLVFRIKIDKNVFRVFLDYLLDNPKVSIPILVSLFGFLGWYIKYRLDKKKKG